MNKGFWEQLAEPFFVLAPLANVTDAAFRKLISSLGKPDVMFTEFVSADGLFLGGEHARNLLMQDLIYSREEKPIVAQFFTSKPDLMEKAARLALDMGFDGVDINMGCPDRNIEKQGACAALIKNPTLAKEIIAAAKTGAESADRQIPVSIKTRIGYNEDELDTWLPVLLSAKPSTVTLHARTRREMSKVPAHWDAISRAVKIRDKMNSKTLIVGNGDVMSIGEAKQKIDETGADGIMLGKAIFGNPWLFANETCAEHNCRIERPTKLLAKADCSCVTVEKKLETMLKHTRLFVELLPQKNFAIMKKHYKTYVNDFPGAHELRGELMQKNTLEEVEKVTENFLKTL